MYCLCIYLAKHWPIYLTLQDWATGNPVCFQNIFNVKLSSNFLSPIKSAHGETDILLTAKGYGAPFKPILVAKQSTWRLEEGSRQHSCHWPLVSRALTLINKHTVFVPWKRSGGYTYACTHMWLERVGRKRYESSLFVFHILPYVQVGTSFPVHALHTALDEKSKLEVDQTHRGLSKCNY